VVAQRADHTNACCGTPPLCPMQCGAELRDTE